MRGALWRSGRSCRSVERAGTLLAEIEIGLVGMAAVRASDLSDRRTAFFAEAEIRLVFVTAL